MRDDDDDVQGVWKMKKQRKLRCIVDVFVVGILEYGNNKSAAVADAGWETYGFLIRRDGQE